MLKYSLIITIKAKEVTDLYNSTVTFYQNELEVFAPEIESNVENELLNNADDEL